MYRLVFRVFGPVIDRFSQMAYRKFSRAMLRRQGVRIQGLPLWISSKAFFDTGPAGITIANEAVVSHFVSILTHDYSLDRFAAMQRLTDESHELVYNAPVFIDEYAFIGIGATVLPGVRIGRGAIVGAASVVTSDVPPMTVVAGSPARFISTVDSYWSRRHTDFSKKRRRP